jgi:hypothetical protein
MVSHDRRRAMVSDNGGLPMIAHDHRRAMIADDDGRAMIANKGLLPMVPDHGTAATLVAIASRRPFMCGNKG